MFIALWYRYDWCRSATLARMSDGSAAHTRGSRAPAASLATAAALWGGLYVISAATFEAIPPATLTLVRLALGVAVLLAFGRLRGVSTGWGEVSHRAAWIAALVAAMSMLLQFGGTALTSGVEGSVVTMATPIFVLLFGRVLDGASIPPRAWGGIALATVGVLILALRGSTELGPTDASRILGMLALIGAGATWALYSSLGRPLVAAIGASRAIGLTAALALAFIAPVALIEAIVGGLDLAAATTPAALGAIAYLAVGATAIGWSLWYRGYAAAPPRVAAAALFLQPLVAAILGVGLLGEAADTALFAGAALLLGGVGLISRGEVTR
jgi:drug/metabolite transporter (DMT)-like permease